MWNEDSMMISGVLVNLDFYNMPHIFQGDKDEFLREMDACVTHSFSTG
jgi:hypothetical protein